MKRSAISSSLLAIVVSLCHAQFSIASAQIVEIPTAADLEEFASEPFRLEIGRSAHQVTLYRGETAVKTYPIAVGRAGWETPIGTFQVFQMLRDPAWRHPLTRKVFAAGDPKNELGRCWIGFWTNGNISVGFHGTPHPETIGKSMSHGCIRMRDKDIEELFEQVDMGIRVTVVP